MDIKNLRENYDFSLIDFNKIDKDPINFFKKWFKEAVEMNPLRLMHLFCLLLIKIISLILE